MNAGGSLRKWFGRLLDGLRRPPSPRERLRIVLAGEGGTSKCYLVFSDAGDFRGGVPPEAIVGLLRTPAPPGTPIEPSSFVPNMSFVSLLHEAISTRGPDTEGLARAARRQGEGWIYVIDQRTRSPSGQVPPEDIVGAFQVAGGRLVPGSCKPNPKHQLVTKRGPFDLGRELEALVSDEIAARTRGPDPAPRDGAEPSAPQ